MNKKRPLPVSEEIKIAMAEILKGKPFSEVTVTDLVSEAGVARASFYRNFSSTADVLDDIIDDLVSEFSHKVVGVITTNDQEAWRSFLFEYIRRVRDSREIFLNAFELNVSEIFSRINGRLLALENSQTYESIEEKYCVSAKLGLISSVLMNWIATGMTETPEEIVDYFMGFIADF
ncbi:MAG: TetR/AcrR family transcriptional regulator [Firmicutes bacterium]|nr:TetR/AcrR family transcriptional regulator [Bacillota bacterium]